MLKKDTYGQDFFRGLAERAMREAVPMRNIAEEVARKAHRAEKDAARAQQKAAVEDAERAAELEKLLQMERERLKIEADAAALAAAKKAASSTPAVPASNTPPPPKPPPPPAPPPPPPPPQPQQSKSSIETKEGAEGELPGAGAGILLGLVGAWFLLKGK